MRNHLRYKLLKAFAINFCGFSLFLGLVDKSWALECSPAALDSSDVQSNIEHLKTKDLETKLEKKEYSNS